MFHAPRIPFDHSLPLVAREPFTLNGAKVEAGARVEGLHVNDAWILWRTLKVDCVPAHAAPVVAAPPPPPILPAVPSTAKPAKQRARAGA